MAVYKVIQDIEAEDKLLGPLSLKGFVYAAISAVSIFISVRIGISGAPSLIKGVIILMCVPPALLFGVLASPLGREQPTEVWLLSRVRFMLKARIRKWDQSGTKQLVTITAPKKIQQQLTKNFSKMEVSSRLQALANTLDSRGWAIKNQALNVDPTILAQEVEENNDRLASATNLTQVAPEIDIKPEDDILDEQNNEKAQNMEFKMREAEEQRKAQLQAQLEAARAAAQEAVRTAPKAPPAPAPKVDTSVNDEQQLLEHIHQEQNELRLHPPKIIKGATRDEVMTEAAPNAKLELANFGEDISVATIARMANSGISGATVGPL